MGSNRVGYGPRAFKQDASNAMKGDIVRGLIELITNPDDAYGDVPHGKIRVEVEHRRSVPWRVVVKDRASGMRKKRMSEAIGNIGARTSGFESGAEVRGNLGRGAKDLAAFGPVTFESICDGYLASMTLEPDGSWDDPVEKKARQEDRERLGIPRGNGTVVTVQVGPHFRCPQHATLLEKLSKHYQLRDINSDPRREVTLVDLNSGSADVVRYVRPRLAEAVDEEVMINGYEGATASVTIYRMEERFENPSSDPGRPEGLLLKGRRAIYENTLFSFESNPHSHLFTGSVSCAYIDKLALEFDDTEEARGEHDPLNPVPIISRSRDGLEREHPFYKALLQAVEPLLERLVLEEERKAKEGEVRESARLRRALDSLGRDLGQLVDADLREIDEDGLGGEGQSGDDAAIRIIPGEPVLYMGENKTLSVVVLRSLGVTVLRVEVDPEGVVELLDDSTVPLEEHPRREDCLIGRIRLRPLIEDDETLLTVRCGEHEADALLQVRPEREVPEPSPPETLEFERARYQLRHQKRRSLLLRAPVDLVNSADRLVRVSSSDGGVVVLGGDLRLEFDEDELCWIGRTQVDPRVLGTRATLTATLGEAVATCSVSVADRDEGGPQLEIKIEDKAMGRFRAHVERRGEVTTIHILGGHSGIKRYLGPGPEFPLQDSREARLVIAEIVAGEAARLVMERKHRSDDLDCNGFYADHLFYLEKYLARAHKAMVPEDPRAD